MQNDIVKPPKTTEAAIHTPAVPASKDQVAKNAEQATDEVSGKAKETTKPAASPKKSSMPGSSLAISLAVLVCILLIGVAVYSKL